MWRHHGGRIIRIEIHTVHAINHSTTTTLLNITQPKKVPSFYVPFFSLSSSIPLSTTWWWIFSLINLAAALAVVVVTFLRAADEDDAEDADDPEDASESRQ